MARSFDSYIEFMKEFDNFELFLETAPYDKHGEGQTKIVLASRDHVVFEDFGNWLKDWPAAAIFSAWHQAQEWANRLGQEVKLVVAGDWHYLGNDDEPNVTNGGWGIKTFRPNPLDPRKPKPEALPIVEVGTVTIVSGWNLSACSLCVEGHQATELVIDERLGRYKAWPTCGEFPTGLEYPDGVRIWSKKDFYESDFLLTFETQDSGTSTMEFPFARVTASEEFVDSLVNELNGESYSSASGFGSTCLDQIPRFRVHANRSEVIKFLKDRAESCTESIARSYGYGDDSDD